jgi:hypothetical protein
MTRRRAPWYKRLSRRLLTLILLVSLGFSAWQYLTFSRTPVGELMVDQAEEALAHAYETTILTAATPQAVNDRLAVLLAEDPRNWAAIEGVEALAQNRDVPITPALAQQREAAYAVDHSPLARSADCLACAWDPRKCHLDATLLCRAPVDLTPIGDVTGIVRESGRYALGMDVDMFELGLSTVGLGALVIAPMTGGSSVTIKAGAGVTKLARRVGAVTPGMERYLTRTAKNAVDWDAMAKTSIRTFPDDLRKAARPKALKPLSEMVDDIGKINAVQGLAGTVHVLKYAENADDVRRLTKLSAHAGPELRGALEVAGKSRVLRSGLKWTDEVWGAITGAIAAMTAAIGIVLSTMGNWVLRILRRIAR